MGSDWEYLCDHFGQVNDGNSDWLADMLDEDDGATKTKTSEALENPFKKYQSKETFRNLKEAKAYAVENPGSIFVRNPNGQGFILKETESV